VAEAQANTQRLQQTLIGLGGLVLAGLLAWGATGISGEAGYAGIGPNFLPWVVALALALCGLLLVVHAQAGGWRAMEPPSGTAHGDWPALLWVAAGVVFNASTITRIGFVLACTGCYMLAVRGLRIAEGRAGGSPVQTLVDAVTGMLIAAPTYWLFTKLLSINLPGLTGTGWI
jgi:putative tricarboxylic transport membrane protein